MMRLIRLIAALALAGGLTILAFTALTLVLAPRYDLNADPADAIVVLSGNFVARGLFVGETRERTEAGLALALAGRAPVVVVTGGDVTAEKMAQEVATGGVPDADILVERDATSTLQNALFTRRILPPDASVIVVTHRYHLPRAVASFKWAGFTRVEGHPADAQDRTDLKRSLSEGLKWPVNIARALAVSVASLFVEDATRLDPLLA